MNNVDAAVPPNEAPEMWHVQLANGELCVMTLDQLDEAFQSGLINESTHVLQAGGTVWAKLGEIAGIEGGEEPHDAAPASVAIAAPEAAVIPAPPAIVPAMADATADSVTAPSAVATGEPLPDALAETFAAMPASTASPATSAGRETEEEIGYIPQLPRLGVTPAPAPVVAAGPAPAAAEEEAIGYIPQLPRIIAYPVAAAPAARVAAIAPVAAASPAPAPQAAPVVQPYDASLFSSSMPSVRPFVADVDLDDVPTQLRSRKRGFVMAAVVVTLLGGVGVAAVNLGGGMSAPSAAAGTSIATSAPVAAPAAPPPPPIAIPELAATADAHKEVRLSDEQRKAVLDADKARAAKHKQRAAVPSRAKHKNGPTPFHAGGSQGDPLNSSL